VATIFPRLSRTLNFNFQDFPGQKWFSRTIPGPGILKKKIQDFPGGVETLLSVCTAGLLLRCKCVHEETNQVTELTLQASLVLGQRAQHDQWLQPSSPACDHSGSNPSHTKYKSKILPEPRGSSGGADLHFHSPQPDTSLHYQTTDTGPVHRAVYLFTPQLSLILMVSTHGGMARLSWPGWLVTQQDGLPAHRWSPIQVLTWLDVQ